MLIGKRQPFILRSWLRLARHVPVIHSYINEDVSVQGEVVDLLGWKYRHPWKTIHFSIPMGQVVHSDFTVTVTPQVHSVRSSQIRGERHSKAMRVITPSEMGLKIAANAMTLLGKPYMWGGSTVSTGFDCSGLIQYVLRSVGIAAPRTTWQQFGLGTVVAVSSLQPGDLVFFSTYANGPTHVGIYVGNHRFVNALNSSTGVILSSLEDPYFAQRFMGACKPWSGSMARE